MIYARQSTAIIVTVGPVLDASGVAVTDGVVGDFKISKNGGAPAALNASATLTHRHTGHYSLSLTATDVNTVGTAEVVIDDTVNACPMKEIVVLEEAIYDAIYAASANAWSGTAGSTTLTALASGAITAAVIATGAVDADALAADAVTEIQSGLATAAALDTVDNFLDTEIAAIISTLGTPSNLGSGATVAANLVDIEGQTDDIGAAGAGLSAVPWNATWDAEVQSEVDDALVARNLHRLIAATGTVSNGGEGTATVFRSDLTAADDAYNDAIIVITSGALANQSRPILDYAQTNGQITLEEGLTAAPSNGVTFVILASHVHPVSQLWTYTTRTLTALDEDSTTLDLDATIRAAVGLTSANLDTQLADLPTVAEFEARTLVAASYATASALDAVDNFLDTEVAAIVTAIGTPSNLGGGATLAANLADVESQTDDIGVAGAGLTAVWATALTESYRGTGAAGTGAQLLYELLAHLGEFANVGTTKTLKKLDGSTTAKTFTYDDAGTPTSITETT